MPKNLLKRTRKARITRKQKGSPLTRNYPFATEKLRIERNLSRTFIKTSKFSALFLQIAQSRIQYFKSISFTICTTFLLFLALSETHAGLNDVDYIVGEFLTLVDNVHIDRTDGVSVLVVVDIGDVLRLQLVAVVVDLVLDIE